MIAKLKDILTRLFTGKPRMCSDCMYARTKCILNQSDIPNCYWYIHRKLHVPWSFGKYYEDKQKKDAYETKQLRKDPPMY